MVEVFHNRSALLYNNRVVSSVKERCIVEVLGYEGSIVYPYRVGKMGSPAFLPGFFKVVVAGAAGKEHDQDNGCGVSLEIHTPNLRIKTLNRVKNVKSFAK